MGKGTDARHSASFDLSQPLTSLSRETGDSSHIDAEQLTPHRGRSYVRGGSHPSLSRHLVWEILNEAARQYGSSEAAVFCETGTRWSWTQLQQKAEALAAGLLALGLKKGDRLAIWSPNNEQWLLTQFATARAGIILVTINPAYRSSELEYALNKSGARALIMADHFKSSDYLAMLNEVVPELASCRKDKLVSARVTSLRTVIRIDSASRSDMPDARASGTWHFDEVMKLAGPASQQRLQELVTTLDPDDAINIQFTSGTTGSPKGATLSHYNIVNNAIQTVARLHLNHQDKLCIPVPLYHCFGMVMGTLGCATVGACMVFPGQAFDAGQTLQALTVERCTALYGVPTMFVAMLEHEAFDSSSLSQLRTGIMAGAPCPRPIMQRVISDMNMHQITIAYGMTETSPVSFQSHINDDIDQRVSTVGRVHPHTEVKIIDTAGQIVPPGTEGELCTRGYSVMQGYWQNESASRQSIDEAGWMHSGDLAIIDQYGYCSIVGRVKDMIIRGGENIYPREIEEFLLQNEKISDVQVFGIPDEKLGEQVCAWVVPVSGQLLTESELQGYCKGRLAHYKVPHFIRFKSELPLTVTGKPKKFVMQDEMIKELSGTNT